MLVLWAFVLGGGGGSMGGYEYVFSLGEGVGVCTFIFIIPSILTCPFPPLSSISTPR